MATPNLVPRSDAEGQIGTTTKGWGLGVFRNGMTTGDAGYEKTIKATGTSNAAFMISNAAATGADASIDVERGSTGADARLLWDESETKWMFGIVGTMKEVADAAELYIVKTDAGATAGYLGNVVDTDQFQITDPGDLLQIKDIYLKLSGGTVTGDTTFSGTNGILVSTITEALEDGGITLAWDSGTTDKEFDVAGARVKNVTTNETSEDTDAANKGYVDAVAQGLHWKHPVINITNTPPSPTEGMHYATGDNPTGAWATHPYSFANYTNSAWAFEAAEEGDAFWNETDNKQYVFADTEWVSMGSTTVPDHNVTTNKQGGTTAEYYHLTNAQHSNLTGNAPTFTTSVTAPTMYVDHLIEKTSSHGVVVDDILTAGAGMLADTIDELTPDAGVLVEGVGLKDAIVYVDTVSEMTDDTGVTIDGVLLKDGDAVLADAGTVYTDHILEKVTDHGVDIELVHFEDGDITLANAGTLAADHIVESATDHGVDIETVHFEDGDISAVADIDATGALTVDTINEHTLDAGVTIEGVAIENGDVALGNAGTLTVDHILEKVADHGVSIDGTLIKDGIVKTDTVNEFTTDAGVTIEGMLLKDAILSTDNIHEKTANTGVTIDELLIKDGGLSLKAGASLLVDHVGEKTSAHTVVFDNSVTIAATKVLATDTINETTGAAGVTIDSVLIKDGGIELTGGSALKADHIDEKTSTHGVMIDGVLIKDNFVNTDKIISKTTATYSVQFDDTNKRWMFSGLKAGGTDVYNWTWEIDSSGDLQPYVAAA